MLTIRVYSRLEKLENAKSFIQDQQAANEIAQWYNNCVRIYNSPDEAARRASRYKKLQEISELRKAALYNGIPMNTYPLPFKERKGYDNN